MKEKPMGIGKGPGENGFARGGVSGPLGLRGEAGIELNTHGVPWTAHHVDSE